MKKFYLSILLFATIIGVAFAQVPNAFNYQAVVRNSSGEILANKTVSFRISLLKNSESGTVVYSETHSLKTNDFGLVNLKIGKGTKLAGTFSPGNWGEVIFTKIEFDPAGGSSFSHLATTKLSSVPFAFVAQTVVDDKVDDADADPANEIQTLSLNGTLLELSNGGGSVTLPASGGSGGDNWGAQTVKTNATLTGDGTSAHPLGVVADGDGDDSNELQTLSLSGNDLTLSDGGGTVALPSSPWAETTSEINYLGTKKVYISDNGGSALKIKSGSKANPPKFEVSTGERSAVSIYNESSTYAAFDSYNEEGVAARFSNNSSNPVAIFENYDVGLAAQFKNKIQIKDGTQGADKILTSDADGNASWQVPAAGGSSLWTKSGKDIYRSSGNVGIGTTTPEYSLDIYNEFSSILKIRSEYRNSAVVLEKSRSSDYAAIVLQLNGERKFRAGLLGNDNYSIFVNNKIMGLEIEPDGDVNLTDDLNVKGSLHVDQNADVDGDMSVGQNLEVADELTVSNVTITGSEVQKSGTGSANMIAHAYGYVTALGTLFASSGNVSVVRSAVGKYTVTITGETYSNYAYVAVFSHAQSMKSLGHEEKNGKINVYITKNSDDTFSNAPFSFVIFKL